MAKKPDAADAVSSAQKVISDMQKSDFSGITQLNVALLESFGEVSTEMARFVSQRITEDVKTQQEILQCKSVKDLQRIQKEFLNTAIEQYQANANRLAEIGAKAFENLDKKKT